MTFGQQLATIVGTRIRELRKGRRLSQQQLAERLRSHGPIVSRIERGAHVVDLNTLARIARALGTDLAELLTCIDGVVP